MTRQTRFQVALVFLACSAVIPAAVADVGDSCTMNADCADLNSFCTVGFCSTNDPNNPVCAVANINQGNSCNDNNLCTTGEMCMSGVCSGTAVDCSGEDDQCNDGVCDESDGTCVKEPANEGDGCDDGSLCTTGDMCVSGSCDGTAVDCSSENDQCNDGVCDESDGTCVKEPANEGDGCDDGSLCTIGDMCVSGSCDGTAVDCSGEADQCNDGVCDESDGTCVKEPANEGDGCDDGSLCTTGDMCVSGSCDGTAVDCSGENDQCNDGVCDESDGTCVKEPANEGDGCDDGSLCTTGDMCVSGSCDGTAVDCSGEADQCNDGVCDESDGTCVKEPANEGDGCDDGSLCTTGDTCVSGSCDGTAVDCSSENDQCNDGVCDESDGTCVKEPANEGDGCDDGSLCTTGDTCVSGSCDGTAVDCSSENDQCNDGVCDESDGTCVKEPANEGDDCTDSDLCSVNEVCQSGVCLGSQQDCSEFDTDCSVGACDSSTGQCEATAINEGNECDDGDSCTDNDTCTAGECTGDDADPLHLGGQVYSDCERPLKSGVANLAIEIDCNEGEFVMSTMTDCMGFWDVADVPCGECKVTVVPPPACGPDAYQYKVGEDEDDGNMVFVDVEPGNEELLLSIQFIQRFKPFDMDGSGYFSHLGDLPVYVECVYWGSCTCPGTSADAMCGSKPEINVLTEGVIPEPCVDDDCRENCACRADCGGPDNGPDGLLTIAFDVPCFKSCVFKGECGGCENGKGGGRGPKGNTSISGFTVGGAVFNDPADPFGSGVVGIGVYVFNDSGFKARTSTGDIGIWRIDGLEAGTYTVVFGGGTTATDSNSQTIEVAAGSEVQNQGILYLTKEVAQPEATQDAPSRRHDRIDSRSRIR